jgi:ParB/RepB/Spo0J family partition protein
VSSTDLPAGLALVPMDHIHPGALQPRSTVSIDLVRQLAESMRAGRHEPLLDVEPSALHPGHFQIVCGEQRWRAAKEAGVERVLVRVLDGLSHVARLQKQHEENELRAGLTPADDAHLVLSMKTAKDIEVAERLLANASVPFEPLAQKHVGDRAALVQHLEDLKALLLENDINVVHSESGATVRPLSPWRETEKALGISEVARKRKLSVLRLEPDVLAEVNSLPANHAPLVAQVEEPERRAALAERALHLTNRQLQKVVRRLREDKDLSVDAALNSKPKPPLEDPLAFETQMLHLADLCRQLARLVRNLWSRTSEIEREDVRRLLDELVRQIHAVDEEVT